MWILNDPPEMAGKVYGAALIGFLEQFAAVQCSLGDEGIVVLLGKSPGAMECARDNTYGLELGTRIANRVLVDGECLSEELIAVLFECCLICYFATHHKQPQSEVRAPGVYTLVEIVDALVHESVKG